MALSLWLVGCAAEPWRYPRADVILVVIDTLRADGLSSYGNPRPTSPNLDRLAESSALFEVVFAPAPQTGPSHATLFTGWNPWVHRVSNNHSDTGQLAHLPDEFETLAERFRAAGYQTAAITDGAILRADFGLTQGFESFDGRYEGVRPKVDRAVDFLEHERDERPLLLFLHTYQVHQPYIAPTEWIERFDPGYDGILKPAEDLIRSRAARGGEPGQESYDFADSELLMRERARFTERDVEHLRAMYDASIAYTDQELNRFWEYLEQTGRLDETLLVITSDHGEEFDEHGHIGHRELYRETLQVPLIVRLPGGASSPAAGRRVSAPVALVDVHRTLLEATGLGSSPETEGFDLLEGLREGHFPDRPIISATTDHFYLTAEDEPSRLSIRYRNHAMLKYQSGSEVSRRLYDYVADPAEAHPLEPSPSVRETLSELDEMLDLGVGTQGRQRRAILLDATPTAPQLDQETLDELRSLGYVR